MTEQEAIEDLIDFAIGASQEVSNLSLAIAIKALEEVQKYRAIGAVSELQDLVIGINALADSQFSAADMAKLVNDMKSLYEYQQISTLEECRAAVEKQKAKKPIPIDYEKYMDTVINAQFLRGAYWCPNCRRVVKSGTHCNDCGQKLDWSDEE